MAARKARRDDAREETHAEVAAFFDAACQNDPRLGYPAVRSEVFALSDRLQASGGSTFHWLRTRYHLDLSPLLDTLLRFRLAWKFENDWRPFAEGASVRDAEKWAGHFDAAAAGLDALRGLLTMDWRGSMAKAVDLLQESPETELDEYEFLRRLGRAEIPRQEANGWKSRDLVRCAVSEAFEQYEVLKLIHANGHGDPEGFDLPQKIEDAIMVLRKAAWTCRRRDWSKAADSSGREIFRRGKRRQLTVERQCGAELLRLFESETSRKLLDHVGALLITTFPETCGYLNRRARSGAENGQRLSTAIGQLLNA